MKLLPWTLHLAVTLFLIFSLYSHNAHAEIFKWTDAQGNTHYSQTPPKDNKAEDIAEDIEMAAGTSSSDEKANAESTETDGDEIADAREAGKKNTVKHKTFCKQQNAALKKLLANPVIKWKSDKEARILSAKERKGKIKEFEKNIKDMCNADVLASKEKVAAQ